MFIFRLLALDLEPDTTLTVITDSFSPVVIKRFYLEYFLFSWEEIQLGYKYLACFEIIWNLSSSPLYPLLPSRILTFLSPPSALVCNPSLCCFTSVLVGWSSVQIFLKYFKIFLIQRHDCSPEETLRDIQLFSDFKFLNKIEFKIGLEQI